MEPIGMRQVVIYAGEDGYWIAECLSLPGCISQGETKEATIANIRDAIRVYVAALEQDGLPVPAERMFRAGRSGIATEVIDLSPRDSVRFVDALLNPPAPNEAVRATAIRHREVFSE